MYNLINKQSILAIVLLVVISSQTSGQLVEGRIAAASSNIPLEYASIGVINTPYGTITDEMGEFSFEAIDLPPDAVLRISMIGFKSQVFTIEELNVLGRDILLSELPILLEAACMYMCIARHLIHAGSDFIFGRLKIPSPAMNFSPPTSSLI